MTAAVSLPRLYACAKVQIFERNCPMKRNSRRQAEKLEAEKQKRTGVIGTCRGFKTVYQRQRLLISEWERSSESRPGENPMSGLTREPEES